MKQIGLYVALFGAASFVLNMVNYELVLLSWIDNWGSTVGTVIRVGMIVVGGALWFVGNQQESDSA